MLKQQDKNIQATIDQMEFQNERQINIQYRIQDGSMWIKSKLKDDFHDILLYWKINMTSRTVTELEGRMDGHPFDDCENSLKILEKIKGLEIGVGVKRNFRTRFPKPEGCTHITELSLTTFDFIISRLYGAVGNDLKPEQKAKRTQAIATFLCNNDSCTIFNKTNLKSFDTCGRFKGKAYEY